MVDRVLQQTTKGEINWSFTKRHSRWQTVDEVPPSKRFSWTFPVLGQLKAEARRELLSSGEHCTAGGEDDLHLQAEWLDDTMGELFGSERKQLIRLKEQRILCECAPTVTSTAPQTKRRGETTSG